MTSVGCVRQMIWRDLLKKFMSKNNVLMSIVIFMGFLFIGTGCSNSNNKEIVLFEETVTATSVIETEETTEATSETVAKIEVKSGLSESEISEIVAELEVLSALILDQTDRAGIQTVLDQFVADSQRDIYYLYYGEADNDFWITPETELPSDYEFSQRPVYQNAVAQGVYAPEAYSDALSGRMIHTVAKSIAIDGEVIGVLGIDILGD